LKIKIIISICLFIIILFSSLNVNAILPKSINNDIWSDGVFEGTIKLGKSYGNITGMINLGRSSKKGVFQSTINVDNTSYEAKGWFINTIIFGNFMNGFIKIPFFGRIDINRSSFEVDLIIPKGSIDAIYTASYLPPVSGEYGIGVKEIHLIDEHREEVLTEDINDNREFMLKVWYPTDDNVEGEGYSYMTNIMFKWLMGRAPIPLPGISNSAYEDVMPHGKVNVPVSSDIVVLPIILFSHGLDGTIEIYSSFIEELVSRGYVVLSMNHPYIAGVVEFPDGRSVYYQDFFSQTDPKYAEKAFQTIIDDAKYVLDYIEVLNAPEGMFNGRLDMEHIGMFGHSFGGASTSVCCAEDDRIDCGLTLDGVSNETFLPDCINKPFFMMTADGRLNSTSVEYIWENEETDIYKMSILGSTHYSYTDVGLLLSHMLPLIPQNLLNFGTIDSKLMTQIVRFFVLEFFDVYLKGEPVKEIIDISIEFASSIQFYYK
jgi:hypothetical protein